jgi:hypothetical protein
MRQFFITTGVLLSASLILLSARKEDCKGVDCKTDFIREGVVVLNTDGDLIELDDAYTFNRRKNQIIRFKDFKFGDTYIVLDDSYQDKLKNRTMQVQFIGMKNGKRVFNEPYVFTADCCHIQKLSGKDTIVIDEGRIRRRR